MNVKRMIAANTANYIRESIQHVADSSMQCPNRVLGRARQFEEGGNLWSPPGSARPVGINRAVINEILEGGGMNLVVVAVCQGAREAASASG